MYKDTTKDKYIGPTPVLKNFAKIALGLVLSKQREQYNNKCNDKSEIELFKKKV